MNILEYVFDVLAAVLAWAAAWSAQNVDAYLGYYAEDFRPADSMPRSVWESQRRDRIESPEHIEVSIQDAVVQAESDERVQVSFVQQYRSDNYSDQTNKEITLLRVDGSWKIVSETALP